MTLPTKLMSGCGSVIIVLYTKCVAGGAQVMSLAYHPAAHVKRRGGKARLVADDGVYYNRVLARAGAARNRATRRLALETENESIYVCCGGGITMRRAGFYV